MEISGLLLLARHRGAVGSINKVLNLCIWEKDTVLYRGCVECVASILYDVDKGDVVFSGIASNAPLSELSFTTCLKKKCTAFL